jgi:hypothetical protein
MYFKRLRGYFFVIDSLILARLGRCVITYGGFYVKIDYLRFRTAVRYDLVFDVFHDHLWLINTQGLGVILERKYYKESVEHLFFIRIEVLEDLASNKGYPTPVWKRLKNSTIYHTR